MTAAKLTALIDADILIYSAAAAAEKTINWGDGLWTIHAYEEEAIQHLHRQFDSIMEKTGATEALMCISAPSHEGWRMKILPSYKGNRAKTRPPMLREFIKQYVIENFKSYVRPTLEGDDILGILLTHPKLIPGDKVCCTIDKDLKTIPGFHYNFGKDEFFTVTQESADFYHLCQTLSGDTTDGYSGCPNIGPDTAAEILKAMNKKVPYQRTFKSGARKGLTETRFTDEPADSAWEVVVSYFDKAGLSEAEALVQARVARICRASDYDFPTKQVKLWNPQN
jgi:5'-3' exonuclease